MSEQIEGVKFSEFFKNLPMASESEAESSEVMVRTQDELKRSKGNSFGGKQVFYVTYGSTTFADIEQAIADGKCVKCDVSGYTYELVQVLSDKITFALTNNVNGTISQETIWVTSDDEWDGESVNVACKSYVDNMLGNIEALLEAI